MKTLIKYQQDMHFIASGYSNLSNFIYYIIYDFQFFHISLNTF